MELTSIEEQLVGGGRSQQPLMRRDMLAVLRGVTGRFDGIQGETVSVEWDGREGGYDSAFTDAIDALPAAGGTVTIGAGVFRLGQGITTGTKPVRFLGVGREASVLSGSGIPIVTLAASYSSVENLKILDPVGYANTIGVDVNNGAEGVAHWAVKDCYIRGGPPTPSPGLGTGIRTEFGLKGVVDNVHVEKWGRGVHLTGPYSNANHFVSSQFRVCVTGMEVAAGGADDGTINACTIEGNTNGYVQRSGRWTIGGSHFENIGANPLGIHVLGGVLTEFGNKHYNETAYRDLVVEAGFSGEVVSWGSLYASGVTHNGTGVLTLYHLQTNTPRQGTGRIHCIGQNGTTPPSHKVVTGSRGGNAALASALTALSDLGIIVNSTTA